VKEKLYSLGLWKKMLEKLFRNDRKKITYEERFAIQFAGGKFRMKQWEK